MHGELKTIIELALKDLYGHDKCLVRREVNERSLTFRFGHYLIQHIKNSNFDGFDVDAEYNRNGTNIKELPSRPHGTYPDIIVHKRNSNDNNALVIEFKCHWNDRQHGDSDITKLKEFTNQNNQYKYSLGAFILIKREIPQVKYFINGIEVELDEIARVGPISKA